MASLTSSFAKRSVSHASLGAAKANETGTELGDVAEKSDYDGSEAESSKSNLNDSFTASAVAPPAVMPPPRRSSAYGTKRSKSKRLLKTPKLPDALLPCTNRVSTPLAGVEDVEKSPKSKSKWSTALRWTRRSRPKVSGGCIGV